MSGLDALGEFGLIKALTGGLPETSRLLCGPGDDCAVVQLGGGQVLLSCDAMVEGIHFGRDWMSPEDIGWKAGAAALSDIAAMGGVARCILVTLGCASDTDPVFLKGLYAGIAAVVSEYGVAVAGGDTVRTREGVFLDVAVVGEMEDGITPRHRSNARPGDIIAVTGCPGSAALGLHALEQGDITPATLIEAHTRPRPRLAEGAWLARESAAHAMIDISDGIASDLGHIAERSSVHIEIETAALPVSPEMRVYAKKTGRAVEAFALGGGEDYELVVTLAADEATALRERFVAKFDLPFSFIGVAQPGAAGVFLDGSPVGRQGYDHFSTGK